MRRDSIFYKFFQQSPMLLFDLIPNPPANADAYRFDSVAVKEPRFEIDGVFLLPEDIPGPVYFCEVQMQKDERLYERLFAETALYFYRNRDRCTDWQIVVIYPSRSTEQSDLYPHRVALSGEQVHRIYLNELGDIQQLPLWVGLMVLTTIEEATAVADARDLISRAQVETTAAESRVIIDMVATIIWYKFEQLSRSEIEAMLDIPVRETRLYQEGIREGIQRGEANLILRLLQKRLGEFPEAVSTQVKELSLADLEELSDSLMEFSELIELQDWLQEKSNPEQP
ncbi:Rpn family recombination-promoting nuclease/putative transposase [cf. Phormidesmis sp. LEGE 11477]|uniref:Rpn family recombination-promoting nuclease/putative transposase n=1 Tax=cf. Phormidesmis sp. LEGE 11477 TaxID=1828680 RepID=UPI0018813D79|nr:Rpn family recombination-promoting nuclease/putative transposase [cf. Phormidesmis sp. LEGE 11477]MBE9062897.1 Rpn family recombination-promoting nuclease/putative transposase [cf. Phormidesmis sp. LEGE 11477]